MTGAVAGGDVTLLSQVAATAKPELVGLPVRLAKSCAAVKVSEALAASVAAGAAKTAAPAVVPKLMSTFWLSVFWMVIEPNQGPVPSIDCPLGTEGKKIQLMGEVVVSDAAPAEPTAPASRPMTMPSVATMANTRFVIPGTPSEVFANEGRTAPPLLSGPAGKPEGVGFSVESRPDASFTWGPTAV